MEITFKEGFLKEEIIRLKEFIQSEEVKEDTIISINDKKVFLNIKDNVCTCSVLKTVL